MSHIKSEIAQVACILSALSVVSSQKLFYILSASSVLPSPKLFLLWVYPQLFHHIVSILKLSLVVSSQKLFLFWVNPYLFHHTSCFYFDCILSCFITQVECILSCFITQVVSILTLSLVISSHKLFILWVHPRLFHHTGWVHLELFHHTGCFYFDIILSYFITQVVYIVSASSVVSSHKLFVLWVHTKLFITQVDCILSVSSFVSSHSEFVFWVNPHLFHLKLVMSKRILKCKENWHNFCYICGKFTLKKNEWNVTNIVKNGQPFIG